MALDLDKVFLQIEAAVKEAGASKEDRRARLQALLLLLDEADLRTKINARFEASKGGYVYSPAGVYEELSTRRAPPAPPESFAVAATDGSHIETDRHLALRAYLINVGGCVLAYGASPDAYLFSTPTLYAREEELSYSDPDDATQRVPVEGPVLGFKRAVEEMRALADLAKPMPESVPLLALQDGTLALWRIAGEHYKPFLRKLVIEQGLVPALDALYNESKRRPLAVAAYVSLPGSSEVVNALRLALCPFEVSNCQMHCHAIKPGERKCDGAHGFVDRNLFEALLASGERSALFFTRSPVVRDHYGKHQVFFFYLNVGEEVARVEVPQWVAEDEALLGMTHALVLDQCRRGQGYPAALSESHEQAVVTGGDREQFRLLVEEALWGERMPVYTSEKNRSKRQRWL